jgi:hypothetical protein
VPNAGVQLDEQLERLYGLPLTDFVRARNELARALRSEGRAEDAGAVAKLPKPSAAAWAVNQLARRRRRDVDLLLDAGHRLREAQRDVVAKGERGDAFDRAVADERRALRTLAAAAVEILAEDRGNASDALVERVLATLRAAAVTDEGRELLARGAFSEELSATGFGFTGDVPTAPPASRRRADTQRRDRRERVAAARSALQHARVRLREAERTQRAAEREEAAAERALEKASERLRAAEAAAEESRAAVQAAEAALESAEA